jgi:hypothetical protein
MNFSGMPRKQRMFRLDERILVLLDETAKKAGFSSGNQFVEMTLFNLLKMSGAIPPGAEPLPETRGKRSGAGKPKQTDNKEECQDAVKKLDSDN